MSLSLYRPFVRALYPVGPLLAVASVIDPLIRVYPFHLGTVGWRFGTVGLLTDSLVGFVFGVVWTIAIAAILDDRRTARVLSAFMSVVAIGLLAVLALFVLDALQVRAGVQPSYKTAYDVSVIKAAATMAISFPIALAIGIAGWRSTRPRGAAAPARTAPAVLLNRQPKEVMTAEAQVVN